MEKRQQTDTLHFVCKRAGLSDLSHSGARYLNFGSVYFMQGWVPGFSLTALFNFLSGRGVNVATLGGFFGAIGLPWALQFLWGPIVDQGSQAKMGRQRSWIVIASAAAFLSLSLLLVIHDPVNSIYMIGAVFFLHSIFASLLDTAIDAQLISSTPQLQRGKMSAVTRGCFVLGGAASAALFAFTLARGGFDLSVGLLLVTTLALNLPALLIKETSESPLFSLSRQNRAKPLRLCPYTRTKSFFLKLFVLMRTPQALLLLVFCFGLQFLLSTIALALAVQLVQVYGWPPLYLSQLQASGSIISGTLGVGLMGYLSDQVGHRKSLSLSFLLVAISFLIFAAFTKWTHYPLTFFVIVMFVGLVPDLLGVVFAPVLMDQSRKATVATQFALFMAVTNLGDIVGAGSSSTTLSLVPLSLFCLVSAAAFFAAFMFMNPLKDSPAHSAE